MPVYQSSEQFYENMKLLFQRLNEDDSSTASKVSSSKLIYRVRLWDPKAEITINARSNPVKIDYGSSNYRPDLELDISADAFHQILLGELPLSKALGSGQMKVKGPVFKTFALADIFHRGQQIYPEILSEQRSVQSGRDK